VITPDPEFVASEMLPRFGNAHPVGGPVTSGKRQTPATRTEAFEDRSGDEYDQFKRHARNFLDCVKSRQEPYSDLESAHRVATACHLANLSLRLGRKLRWDAAREAVIGDAEAEALLERPYRAPWADLRKALLREG
jgi:hypothetical protein